MDTPRAELEVEAQMEQLDRDLRLLHGLCAEIGEALEGADPPAHQGWKHLRRQNLGVCSDLQPGAVDGEARARLRAFKDRLMEAHPRLARNPRRHPGPMPHDDP